MKYARILMAVASEIWAIQPEKLAAICDFLALQADGVKFGPEEVEARIAHQTAAAVARREGAIAILPLRGVMSNRINLMGDVSGGGGTSVERLGRDFDAAVADEGVKAIVLDVDSPGGSVMGVEELSAQIFAARGSKPIVAQVNATAASAAYWACSGCDEVVLTPSGWVGSIGALQGHDDVSAALEKVGVKRTIVTSAEFKAETAAHLPLSDEARAHLQSQVDYYGEMFIDRVASNRGVAASLVKESYGKGRMVVAREAIAHGMADRVATMAETLARFGAKPAAASQKRSFAAEREKRALDL